MTQLEHRTIPFGKPILDENEFRAVIDVLKGATLVHGPKTKEFEQAFAAFTKAPHATSVGSCTAGLHLAHFYYGIGAGDEVIVPAQTHVATAHAVELCGAKPVFVDAEIRTGNIDIEQIEAAITPATKAISIVHFLGMPVDMGKINVLARKHQLYVVEDCALAIGTFFGGIHAGLWGDVGAFSFYPVKHMTTIEGGMMLMKSDQMAAKIERQKAFGVDRHVGERKTPGMYDVPLLGFNYRMNEVEAAIGVEQMKRIPGFLERRRSNYEVLESGLKELPELDLLQSSYGEFQSSYYCLSILLKRPYDERRAQIMESLKAKGVGVSIYYPQAVPHLSYYKQKYGYQADSFPVAKSISGRSIALSVGPHLNEDDMRYTVSKLKEAFVEASR